MICKSRQLSERRSGNVADLLLDIGVSSASPANADTDIVVVKVLLCELPHLLVERGREEKIAMIAVLVGVWGKVLVHIFAERT